MVVEQAALRQELTSLIGADRVASSSSADAVDGIQPALVVEPASIDEAAKVMAWANQAGLSVAPRGGGTKMGWGNIPRSLDLVLSTRRLNSVIEHAAGDMTITVQCGLTLGALRGVLEGAGQMLALDAPFADRTTIGGLIATNESGPLRVRYGGLRDLVLGVTLVKSDGVVARGGGKVVKNVAGYDLPKLLTGSLGTLALLVQATFRLHPLPPESQTVLVKTPSIQTAGVLVLDVLSSTLTPTGVTLRWYPSTGCHVFLRFSGIRASVLAQLEQAYSLVKGAGWSYDTLGESEATAAWSDLGEQLWSHRTPSAAPVTGSTPAGDHTQPVDAPAIVARCSVLLTEIPVVLAALEEISRAYGLEARAVVHGHGLGLIRLETSKTDPAGEDALVEAVEQLRHRIIGRDGTLVVRSAPLEVKRRLDVWGAPTDALPLMRRLKAQFDPKSMLNPGRFLGGI